MDAIRHVLQAPNIYLLMASHLKRKVLFLIESLSGGGAEKVLTVLLKYFDYERYEMTVCPIVDTGIYCEDVRKFATHYLPVVSYRGNVFSRFLNRVKYKLVYSVLPLSEQRGIDFPILFSPAQ